MLLHCIHSPIHTLTIFAFVHLLLENKMMGKEDVSERDTCPWYLLEGTTCWLLYGT